SRRRHTGCYRVWSSDVCSSDLAMAGWARYTSSYQAAPLGEGAASPTAAIADSVVRRPAAGVTSSARVSRRAARHATPQPATVTRPEEGRGGAGESRLSLPTQCE